MNYPADRPTGLTTVTPAIGPNDSTFPENVLRRIFHLYIEEPVVLLPPRGELRQVLAQVCATWQAIIISTPTFWSSFSFTQCQWGVRHPNNLIQLAEVFFRRAGKTTPLAINLGGSLQSDLGRIIFVLTIRPHAHRVWFLSCMITRREIGTILGLGHVHFPLLQVIAIGVL